MNEPPPSSASAPPPEWMEAAHLLRPQGRRGELLADPSADFNLFTPDRRFALGDTSHAPKTPVVLLELEAAWQPTGRNAGRLVLKLRGTDSIAAAEALAGQHLFLRTDELPALEDGTYRVRDLAGCTLYDGDLLVGTVIDLQFPVAPDGRTRLPDAPDLLVVEPALAMTAHISYEAAANDRNTTDRDATDRDATDHDATDRDAKGEPVLVPFVRAWLLEVDLVAKRLRMRLPPGLFDTAE